MRALRHRLGIRPVYKTVDTCAAEFAATTPYHYSSYDEETEVAPQPDRPKVIILGSGPNRIGQGIEFDYSCVHAVMALREAGYETVMVNCNPETVSTDYDTADRLYFEPLTFEDVLEVVHAEQQSGTVAGRHLHARRPDPARPRAAAQGRRRAGARHPARGDRPRRAPRRVRPGAGRGRPAGAQARHGDVVRARRRRSPTRSATRCWCGRPTCSAGAAWRSSTTRSTWPTTSTGRPRSPPITPCSSTDSSTTRVEIDVDALYDGTDLYLGGVMEHIEEAGIHSGDSACALPPITLGAGDIDAVRRSTLAIAQGVGVRGLLNVQYALVGDVLYVLEANPRASRTVPFVSKATAVPAGQGGRPHRAGRDDRRAARRGPAAARPATAATCPPTRRSRSRRPCCRSTGSARRAATRSTRSSGRR